MDGVVEIIAGRERRRHWIIEQKFKVVGETQEPATQVSDVAARHGSCESLLFSWRRQVREGCLVAPEMAVFVPLPPISAARKRVGNPGSGTPPISTDPDPPSGAGGIDRLIGLRTHMRLDVIGARDA